MRRFSEFFARAKNFQSQRRITAKVVAKPNTHSLETLEDRTTPAITLQFDYSLDANGFFSDPARKAVLQAAADTITSKLTDSLTAITPGGNNKWTAIYENPATGQFIQTNNLTIAADTIIIFAGGRSLGGGEAGVGGFGGFSGSGSTAFLNNIASRGQPGALLPAPTDFGPWGGTVTFDTQTNWYFSTTFNANQAAGKTDFFSVAVHELSHALGFGTADSWTTFVSGTNFIGPVSMAEYDKGGAIPLSFDQGHWANGTTDNGQEAAMDPSILNGTRKPMTKLDFAGLDDLGWSLSAVAANQAPVNTVPAGPITLNQDTSKVISGISVFDADAGAANIEVSMSVVNGALSVNTSVPGGVTFGQVIGNSSSFIAITATLAQINATLASANGLTYVPNAGYSGSDTLTVVSNDLGNTGSGGAKNDVDLVPVTVVAQGGNGPTVSATDNADIIDVTMDPNDITKVVVTVNGVNNGSFSSTAGAPLRILGLGGNDIITTASNVTRPLSFDGGTGNDQIVGGGGADTISGGVGNDSLIGFNGNDLIFGGDDFDTIDGGNGNDSIDGNAGFDVIFGQAGADLIFGSAGNDFIDGGDGNDNIDAGIGDDTVAGQAGFDFIAGGDGNDSLVGGADDDGFEAGEGNDFIQGGDGDDFVYGQGGVDTIFGEAGDDGIDAGAGNDFVDGGIGDDFMYGLDGNDTMLGQAGFDGMDGGAGDDSLLGGDDGDLIFGAAGNDSISGGAGDDSMNGDAGNDTVDGGDDNDLAFASGGGIDILRGGAGNDTLQNIDSNATIFGGAGNDFLFGANFINDSILGEDGNDFLLGLSGNDTFVTGSGADSVDGGQGVDVVLDATAQDTLTNVP